MSKTFKKWLAIAAIFGLSVLGFFLWRRSKSFNLISEAKKSLNAKYIDQRVDEVIVETQAVQKTIDELSVATAKEKPSTENETIEDSIEEWNK